MRRLTREDFVRLLDRDVFRLITEVADQLGVECYVIGGFVRDFILSRPSKDIDVVVVGSGIELARAVGARIGRGAHISVFRRFGTAQLSWRGGCVEFVGARRESYSADSRKPAVENGTLEDDLRRRDFTINALALCLNRSIAASYIHNNAQKLIAVSTVGNLVIFRNFYNTSLYHSVCRRQCYNILVVSVKTNILHLYTSKSDFKFFIAVLLFSAFD